MRLRGLGHMDVGPWFVGGIPSLCILVSVVTGHRAARAWRRASLGRQRILDSLAAAGQRHQALVDHLSLAIFRFTPDPHGRFITANAAMSRVFGYINHAEFLLSPVNGHFPSADACQAFCDRVLSNQALHGAELRLRKRDGTAFWGRVSAWVVRSREGAVYIEGTVEDVDAHKRIEDRLRLRLAAIEAAQDMIVITDPAGCIEYVNPSFTRCTGYAADEVIGRSPRLLKSGHHEPAFYASLWKTICAGEIWEGQVVNRRKDGGLYDEEMSITPVRDESGAVTRFVAIKRDITRRKRAEEESCRARLAAENESACLRRQTELLTGLINHIPQCVFWKDRQSIYLGCGKNFAKAAGLADPRDVLGKTDYDLPWTREQTEFYRKCDQEVMAGGRPMLDIEETQLAPDGSLRQILTSKVPLRDETGRVVGILGIYSDVTERRRSEQDARDRAEEVRLLLESSGDGILGLDLSGKVRFCNTAAAQLLGYADPAQLAGSDLHGLAEDIGADDAVAAQRDCPILRAVATVAEGKPVALEDEVLWRRDGTSFSASCHAFPTRRGGRVTGAVVTIVDITDRKAAEAAARERESLHNAVLGMEQVIGVLGHELRTPLAGLRAISELLLDRTTRQTDQADKFLRNMNGEIVRMSGMVNNMLEAARLSSGVARWQWDDVALAAVCEQALAVVRPMVDGTRVRLTSMVEPLGLSMRGDADAVCRLILNLVSNAQQHTREGAISVAIRCRATGAERWVDVQVKDTGEGIAPQIVAKMGQAFALNSGVTGMDHVRGSGLGLAICKGIVAAHGGTLSVRSHVGMGTTITASLRADLSQAVPLKDIVILQEPSV